MPRHARKYTTYKPSKSQGISAIFDAGPLDIFRGNRTARDESLIVLSFHWPAGFSLLGSFLGATTNCFSTFCLSSPSSVMPGPPIRTKSPALPDFNWHSMHLGPTLSGPEG